MNSGVGVLDKAVSILNILESTPATLAQLVDATHLARPTAYRLAVALEYHRLVDRDQQGRFTLGSRLAELAGAAGDDRLLAIANPVLSALRDHSRESCELYRRQGDQQICVASVERPIGLRVSIPVGTLFSLQAGSSAQILLAWEDVERQRRTLRYAKFNATQLSEVRRRGWAQSVSERETGVASVSAPVRASNGHVVAALTVAGPIERLGRQPGRDLGPAVVAAAQRLTEFLRRDPQ